MVDNYLESLIDYLIAYAITYTWKFVLVGVFLTDQSSLRMPRTFMLVDIAWSVANMIVGTYDGCLCVVGVFVWLIGVVCFCFLFSRGCLVGVPCTVRDSAVVLCAVEAGRAGVAAVPSPGSMLECLRRVSCVGGTALEPDGCDVGRTVGPGPHHWNRPSDSSLAGQAVSAARVEATGSVPVARRRRAQPSWSDCCQSVSRGRLASRIAPTPDCGGEVAVGLHPSSQPTCSPVAKARVAGREGPQEGSCRRAQGPVEGSPGYGQHHENTFTDR